MKKIYFFILLSVLSLSQLQAKVSLPAIFADHMVLQQKSEVPIWGWAKPLEDILIVTGWDNKRYEIKADNHANWNLKIKTPQAGGPYSITIIGSNTITLQDILIGEVWVCSGQSNMEWSPKAGIINGTNEILKATNPSIRFFQVNQQSSDTRQLDCKGTWAVCTPETMIDFSAIGYFFGKKLQEKLNIPIGLINTSWGGTPAEAWSNPEVIKSNESLKIASEKLQEVPWCPVKPGSAYNAMLAPLIPYEIAGSIWYQGEGNTANYETYETLFQSMIQSWREEWEKDFPFYYVQIAPYAYGRTYEGVLIREAQLHSLASPNTGMVVVSDIGNIRDIHPRNKIDVGQRLANLALNKTYEMDDLPCSGPIYNHMVIEKNKIRVFFDYAENGLDARGGKLTQFQIAGDNKIFVDAEAIIDGKSVIVYAKELKAPTAVRFAFTNTSEPNLFNKEGLPASSFRTDDWEVHPEPIK